MVVINEECIIDLNENVLRVGGGEVSVPFLQGRTHDLYLCMYKYSGIFMVPC